MDSPPPTILRPFMRNTCGFVVIAVVMPMPPTLFGVVIAVNVFDDELLVL